MSLNNINLSPAQMVDFYAAVLIELNSMISPETGSLQHIGGNEKGILIVVANEDVPYLGDKELSFLTSILSACTFSLQDVAIVNYSRIKKGHDEIYKHLKINTILLFGLSPIEFGLPINFPHYQAQAFDNRTYLSAPPLLHLEDNKNDKKSLWIVLKKHFDL